MAEEVTRVRLLDVAMTALSVRPGDVIVLMVEDHIILMKDDADLVVERVKELFPGHNVLGLNGIKIGVMRPEEQKASPYGPCGMRYHADDCDCQGMGGDR